MDGLTSGRMVHYVLPDGPHMGEHRPAVIVKVWSQDMGTSNLQVFMDGLNDSYDKSMTINIKWVTSSVYSEDVSIIGTWHWIEKA